MVMQKIFQIILTLIILANVGFADHPSLYINESEAQNIKASLGKYELLDVSFNKSKSYIDGIIDVPIEIPEPGEAGGYAHERHKQNYRDMQQAGVLYSITKDEKYARFVKNMLLQYAEFYPNLGPHPLAHNQAPGKLFHQMLNETVWLVYTSQAYDCIYNYLTASDRDKIENNIFKKIITSFTVDHAREFDRIHNHGTWSVASIGMLGMVLNDQNLVEMALYGTKKDGEGGFLKQLDRLFSPDGYYMEGPYYIRYALRPFFLFADALERNRPDIKIYEYRNGILKKALFAALMTTFPDGIFPPINDASKSMDISAAGALIATDIGYYRYGRDINLLGVKNVQAEVILNGAGLKVAQDYAEMDNVPDFTWPSVEFNDGYDGKQGGLGILRAGKGKAQTMLLMKYGVHGEGHGHFDKLHFIFYQQEREIINDYGYARWINIETKYGGRYLPENKSYAKQTIAHNTVVVDQTTQNMYQRKEAEATSGKRHFFDISNPDIQVMSARADNYYPGVKMQRTMFLINNERLEYPVVIDLYRLESEEVHTYDYPVHFTGQLMITNFEYETNVTEKIPINSKFGYQHIWNDGKSKNLNQTAQVTWLNGHRYYTVSTAAPENSEIIFGRIGANDPNFNLRAEPLYIVRSQAKDCLFASIIEPHGFFNEAQEKSRNAKPIFESVQIIGHNSKASVLEITIKNGFKWQVMVNNGDESTSKTNNVKFNEIEYIWTGNYKLKIE
jgi:oligo-alginate lyase